jgi:hypothetical protein
MPAEYDVSGQTATQAARRGERGVNAALQKVNIDYR